MEVIARPRCVITGRDDLEHLYTFPNFPVFMGCSHKPVSSDVVHDMQWWISKSTGSIQLNPLLPLDVLYPESHGAGVVGALWQEHHRAFATFLHTSRPTEVLEIGGSHGILEKEYQGFEAIPWTIVEPNPAPADGTKAVFIKRFFDAGFQFDGKFDAIVHSHVFEHLYHPNEFMQQLADFVPAGKQLIFSLPNMRAMLERKYNNCLNFEHTVFLTEELVEYLLAHHGFRLQRKEYFKDDHSIFYAAVRDPATPRPAHAPNLYEEHQALYLDYIGFHTQLAIDINAKIKDLETPVYFFGAHIFAQYMFAFGLDSNLVVDLLDNDPQKHGKRLYGTSKTVCSPEVLRSIPRPTVILRAGVYSQEIKTAILNNINGSTQFIE